MTGRILTSTAGCLRGATRTGSPARTETVRTLRLMSGTYIAGLATQEGGCEACAWGRFSCDGYRRALLAATHHLGHFNRREH
jgi:hypothetical protein